MLTRMASKATEDEALAGGAPPAKKPRAKRGSSTRKRRLPYRILDMEHVSFWEEKRKLPRFMFPFDYSLDPCASCVGYCCQTIVHVTMVEALRVSLPLGVALDDMVRRIPADGERGNKQTVPLPLDEGEVRLVFRQQEGHGGCIFLHAVGARSICSAHALRPGVCRVFPYKVDVGDRVISAGGPIACPTRWLYDERVEARVDEDVRRWLADIDEERALVEAWRAQADDAASPSDRSWLAFQRFAIRRLAGRCGLDADEILRPPRRRLGAGRVAEKGPLPLPDETE